ncbi:DNA translocase FtsK [Acetobacter estunensis]|uniref:DNA translocase FtsK n=1 Tax=Acetobacter estunensis TaxID=104097 RepID=UPI001C2DB772|nr:DNA translocase FtsK [Acetobacter estunensis]MBV1835861.1 DNA translocase FtsK 4TM domain-containing protein [Acetobacter estunensis]MBV1835878.1 DNA translocase FtsK 4TM domain-containing protein [Acetobacter estunensis]
MARLSRFLPDTLSSPDTRSTLRRRGDELGGILLWIFALTFLLAFGSYNPLDPSPDVSTSRAATNLLGAPGAWVADVLIQGIGLATGLLVIALVAWGWRIFRHRGLSVFVLRAVALICLLLVAAALLAAVPILVTAIHPPAWPSDAGIGGGIGASIAREAVAAGMSAIGPAGGVIIWVLGLILALLLGALAFGLDRREWHVIGRTTGRGLLIVGRQPGRLARIIIARQRRGLPSDGSTATTPQNYEPASDNAFSSPVAAIRRSWIPRRAKAPASPQPPIATRRYEAPVAPANMSPMHPNPQPTGQEVALSAPSPQSLPANRPMGRRPSHSGQEEEDKPVISLPGPAPDQPVRAMTAMDTAPASSAVPSRVEPTPEPEPAAQVHLAPQSDPAPHPLQDTVPPHAPREPVADTGRKSFLSRLFPGKDESAASGKGNASARADASGNGQGWVLPPISLLRAPPPSRAEQMPTRELLEANARLLETVLADFGVQGRIVDLHPGPVVTLYELEPAPGIRSARVIGLADDIARSLSVLSVRIATVPGRNVIGIEVPNATRQTVYLSELFNQPEWINTTGKLELALGKDIAGEAVFSDLARMPHLLVAGTTGSGKSVGINAMILSLLFRHSPDECRLIMIDPKVLELSIYDGIPHLLTPVVTEPNKAVTALKWVVREMDRRYRAMAHLQVRNIGGYNERAAQVRERGEEITRRVQTGYDPETGNPIFEEQSLTLEPLPYIVVIIDEMADLMMMAGKEIDAAVQRLAQKARAAGIHVIMATQRPSVDVITGTIKANFPTRISFQVISKFDSRTILGEQGAEQLLGQGDMLFMQGGGRITRVHGPFVADAEVEAVTEFLREQGEPIYDEDVISEREEEGPGAAFDTGSGDGDSSLYDKAVAIVIREGKASTSFVQRNLSIGYNRAAKLIEQMEKSGIVSAADHVGRRKILIGRGAGEE